MSDDENINNKENDEDEFQETQSEPTMDANALLIQNLQLQIQLLQQQQGAFQFGPQIAPFELNHREEWEDWVHLFKKSEFFKMARTEQQRIDRLELAMGVRAAAEFRKLHLKPEDAVVFDKVVEALTSHFMGRKTIVYRRYLFRRRAQQPGETAEQYIMDVRHLASRCKFNEITDIESEMVRDQLVWGLADQQLRETLLAESKLTLERVTNKMRAREQARRENISMATSSKSLAASSETPSSSVLETSSVEPVTGRRNRGFVNRKPQRSLTSEVKKSNSHSSPSPSSTGRACFGCGSSDFSASHKERCPARGVRCHSCSSIGHFAKHCRRTKSVNQVNLQSSNLGRSCYSSDSDEDFFIESICSQSGPERRTSTPSSNASPQTTSKDNCSKTERFVGRILFNNMITEVKFDSGAEVSVIPPHLVPPSSVIHNTQRKLKAAGGKPLKVLGLIRVPLANHKHRIIETFYIVEDQAKMLVGAPAISRLGVLRMDRWSRVDSVESPTIEREILEAYPRMFGSQLGLIPYEYKVELTPGAKPYSVATARNVALPLREAVAREIQRMVKQGVIEKVDSPTEWCAPMVVARKKTGEVRICTDFSQLNRYVRRPRIILPNVESSLAEIGGSSVFSKLDAASGFWQVPLHPTCRDLTTFITPVGRFRYKRLPFGITSAPEFFQSAMSDLLEGLSGVVCHMDDVLVHGRDSDQHDKNLRAVMKRMDKTGLVLNRPKCVFSTTTVKFLGQVISGKCVRPDPDRVRAIVECPKPTTIKGVRSLLGMLNQLAKFIPNLAELSQPIRSLLKKGTVLRWEAPQQEAFITISKAISETTELLRYDVGAQTAVVSDASNEGLGAVLLQTNDKGHWKPVSFGSRTLLPAEKNYASVEKEALAVTWAVEKFRQFLDGKEFSIFTDHQPLISIFGRKDLSQVPLRIQRFKIRLLPYVFTVTHVPGRELYIPDFLSRYPLPFDESDVKNAADVEAYVQQVVYQVVPVSDSRRRQVCEAQHNDTECRTLSKFVHEGWPKYSSQIPNIVRKWLPYRNEIVEVDRTLYWRRRIIIPCELRSDFLQVIHDGHLGARKCQARARRAVFWPSITQDVATAVENCDICRRHRIPRRAPLIHHNAGKYPWQRIAMDIFFFDARTFVIWVDYYSAYVEVAEIKRMTTADLIERSKEVFARYGIPEEVVTDAGAQFTGTEWNDFARSYGFAVVASSPMYHQSNGLAERAVQSVKALLKKNVDWQLALLSLRSSPNASGFSPVELLMGRNVRTRLPFIPTRLSQRAIKRFEEERVALKTKSKANYDRRHRVVEPTSFVIGERVYVPDLKREAVVQGPADTPRSWWLQNVDGRRIRRNQIDLRKVGSPSPYERASKPCVYRGSSCGAYENLPDENSDDEDFAHSLPTPNTIPSAVISAPDSNSTNTSDGPRPVTQDLTPTSHSHQPRPSTNQPAINPSSRSPRPQRDRQKPSRYRDPNFVAW